MPKYYFFGIGYFKINPAIIKPKGPVTTVIGTKAIITGVAEIIGGICAAFLGIGDIIGESE